MIGDILEALDLRVLGEEREERVEHDKDESEGTLHIDVGEVAHRQGDRIAASFGVQLPKHRFGGIDAVNLDTSCRERQRDSSSTDSELEDRGGPSEFGQCLDGRQGIT